MDKTELKNKGFTAVEILVVIAVMSILALIMLVNYRGYNKKNQLREGAQIVRSAIVEAQNMALAPKDQKSGTDYYYGIGIDEYDFLFQKPELNTHKKVNIYRFECRPFPNTLPPDQAFQLIKSYDLPTPIQFLNATVDNPPIMLFPGTYSTNFCLFFKPPNAKVYYPNIVVNLLPYPRSQPPIYVGDWANSKWHAYLSLTDDLDYKQEVSLNPVTGQTVVINPQASPAPPPVCFAADSKVNILNKDGSISSKLIKDVSIGDFVESFDQNKQVTFSEVWAKPHGNKIIISNVLDIEVKDKNDKNTCLSIHPYHLLYVASEINNDMLPKKAREVKVGDKLFIRNYNDSASDTNSFGEAVVTSITSRQTKTMDIFTMNDHIVVNGIAVSPYSHYAFRAAALFSGPKELYKLMGPKVSSKIVDSITETYTSAKKYKDQINQINY